MTTNRLAKGGDGKPPHKSVFRAREWAAMAEAKNLPDKAKAWREADLNGWDFENYDEVAAEAYREKVRKERGQR